MSIRFAHLSDSRALLAIYAQYIGTTVTFESPEPSEADFAGRVAGITAFYPYLVWEEAGRIRGYAYAHRYRERAAYGWDAELSIYLDQNSLGRGIGTKLYGALLELITLQGVINAYGIVSTPNPGSEALHSRLGFTRQCTHRNVGYKLGRWLDVTYYEKQLGPHDPDPAPVLSIHDIPQERVQEILVRYR